MESNKINVLGAARGREQVVATQRVAEAKQDKGLGTEPDTHQVLNKYLLKDFIK